MKQSELFTKTLRQAPEEEQSVNAQLLLRAGFIYKEMAGAYDYLPLGLRVLEKIKNIIREEMNAIGGQEVLMTTLQDPELWKKTNRWNDAVVDNWFKTKLANGNEVGIANTHEEPITAMLSHFVNSYKDLPFSVYQFQTKFRNELRAKSGIMRVREFLMKDMYSFSRTEEEFKAFYESCAEAYKRIFKRTGLEKITYRTIAAGGSFTTGFTDEFQTISEAGEDIIYINKEHGIAMNKEIYTDENLKKFGFKKESFVEKKSIEVGNIFPLGSTYSDALGLKSKNEKGENTSVIMGSYGIGLGRLMGTVAETLSDNKGIVWPQEIAPFQVHLIALRGVEKEAKKLYGDLTRGTEVLYDDRQNSTTGEKFSDADLIGIPFRVVLSTKTLEKGKIEIKRRGEQEEHLINGKEILDYIKTV